MKALMCFDTTTFYAIYAGLNLGVMCLGIKLVWFCWPYNLAAAVFSLLMMGHKIRCDKPMPTWFEGAIIYTMGVVLSVLAISGCVLGWSWWTHMLVAGIVSLFAGILSLWISSGRALANEIERGDL